MKIGFLITARLKSSRLKEKILLNLHGETVLGRVIERCKMTKGVDDIVLCTSTNLQDNPLEEVAKKHNIEIFRGSEDDVLQRLLDAAKNFKIDAFVSITADNPLHDFELASKIIQFYKNEKCDFIFCEGFPVGIAPYFIDTKALEIACYMKKENDTEIWGPFVNRPDFFRIGKMRNINQIVDKSKRLTCDFIEDFELLKQLLINFEERYQPNLTEIVNILVDHPEYFDLNKMHIQRSLSNESRVAIIENFNKNIARGLEYAKSINKELNPSEIIYNLE